MLTIALIVVLKWICEIRTMKTLYSVYRTADDALIAFELPRKECANLLGIKPESLDRLKSTSKSMKQRVYVITTKIYKSGKMIYD